MLNGLATRLKADDMALQGAVMAGFGLTVNLFSYLYQLAMGVLLPPVQYGVLFTFTSLLVIVSVFSQSIAAAVARLTSQFRANGGLGQVNYLWHYSLRRTFYLGMGGFVLLGGLSPLVSRFLKVENPSYALILFSSLMVAFVLSASWGTLQGLQRFLALGSSQTLHAVSKLLLGVLFVGLGLGVGGGLAAIPLSFLLALGLSLFSLRDLGRVGNQKAEVAGLGAYTGLASLAILGITILVNGDMVLAKHYLGQEDAGTYSAIAVLGRIAFYAPWGITWALFPKTAEARERGNSPTRLFLRALILTLALAGAAVSFFGLFPETAVRSLFGEEYLQGAPYLFRYSIGMAALAVSFLVVNYALSLGRTGVVYSALLAAGLQVSLLVLFHARIGQLVDVVLASGLVSLVLMAPFYFSGQRRWLWKRSSL